VHGNRGRSNSESGPKCHQSRSDVKVGSLYSPAKLDMDPSLPRLERGSPRKLPTCWSMARWRRVSAFCLSSRAQGGAGSVSHSCPTRSRYAAVWKGARIKRFSLQRDLRKDQPILTAAPVRSSTEARGAGGRMETTTGGSSIVRI